MRELLYSEFNQNRAALIRKFKSSPSSAFSAEKGVLQKKAFTLFSMFSFYRKKGFF
jgi:hypothetical protein